MHVCIDLNVLKPMATISGTSRRLPLVLLWWVWSSGWGSVSDKHTNHSQALLRKNYSNHSQSLKNSSKESDQIWVIHSGHVAGFTLHTIDCGLVHYPLMQLFDSNLTPTILPSTDCPPCTSIQWSGRLDRVEWWFTVMFKLPFGSVWCH